MKSREIIEVSQDSNREWVSLLAAIYVVILKISLIFIYQRESGDSRNNQIDDVGDNIIYFVATLTRQNNNITER